MPTPPDKYEEEDFVGEHKIIKLFFRCLAALLGFLAVLVGASLLSGSWLPLLLADLLFQNAYLILGILAALLALVIKIQSTKPKP